MPRFVVDEDMPRSTGVALVEEGYEVKDVRDHGRRGSSDDEIYRFAQEEEAILYSMIPTFHHFVKSRQGRQNGLKPHLLSAGK